MSLAEKAAIGAGLAVLALIAWTASRGAASAGAAIGGAAVDLVDGVVSGVVVGAGSVVGIPATSKTQCQADVAAGSAWDASFSCPAGEFLSYWWNR